MDEDIKFNFILFLKELKTLKFPYMEDLYEEEDFEKFSYKIYGFEDEIVLDNYIRNIKTDLLNLPPFYIKNSFVFEIEKIINLETNRFDFKIYLSDTYTYKEVISSFINYENNIEHRDYLHSLSFLPILKIDKFFFFWNTKTLQPETFGLEEDKFFNNLIWHLKRYGLSQNISIFETKLEEAKKFGKSHDFPLDDKFSPDYIIKKFTL